MMKVQMCSSQRKSQMQKADFAARRRVYLTVKASQIQMESDWTYVRKEKEEEKKTLAELRNPPHPPMRLLCIPEERTALSGYL